MTGPSGNSDGKSIQDLTDLEIKQIFDDLEKNPQPQRTNELPEELSDELDSLPAQLDYIMEFVSDTGNPFFVGRVFVATTMSRTTRNAFVLVVAETDATVFFKRLSHIIKSQSVTQEGVESPDLRAKKNLMTSPRRECERGRKVLKPFSQESMLNAQKTFRSRGMSYEEWDGKDCYFDHQW